MPFDQLLLQLEDASSINAKARLVREFARQHTSPIIDGSRAVFYHVSEDALTVALEGDWTSWKPTASLSYLPDTPLWYRVERFPRNARLEYRVVVNGHPRLDPYNPRTALSDHGTHSEFTMPDYRAPREITDDCPITRGTVEQHWMKSQVLDERRTLWICFPPHFSPQKQYPVTYFNDGDGYLYYANLPHIMDYLIESKQVKPFVAVLLRPNNREKEYIFNNQYVRFLVDELVPWMDDNYPTIAAPMSRAIIGASLGALCAAYVARRRPNVFGLVGGQSGYYGLKDDVLIQDFAAAQNLGIRFNLIVGEFETDLRGEGKPEDNLVEQQHRFVDLLHNRGYAVSNAEYPEGHQWGFWRAHIGDALKFFWGAQLPSVSQVFQSRKVREPSRQVA